MLKLKVKRLGFLLMFAIAGGGYFGAFSDLTLHPLLKSYAAIIPLQIAALIYVAYWNWSQRSTRKKFWNESE